MRLVDLIVVEADDFVFVGDAAATDGAFMGLFDGGRKFF
jgi:hypothetical protein